MPETILISFSLDSKIEDGLRAACKEAGISTEDAFNAFAKAAVKDKEILSKLRKEI